MRKGAKKSDFLFIVWCKEGKKLLQCVDGVKGRTEGLMYRRS